MSTKNKCHAKRAVTQRFTHDSDTRFYVTKTGFTPNNL